MKKILFALFIVFAFSLIVMPETLEAQCAMCKATVESNMNGEGKTVGKGLNNGILYLMTIPYIVLGALGYMFWKNWKGNPDKVA
jgi:hypothetical protein